MKLSELVKGRPSVAIIGMCKNAGKTTVLNRLICEFAASDIALALTSVGRDGETADVVTGTGKPPIYIYQGTLVATAEELLKFCDVSREIIDVLNIHTPLGRVVLFRAMSDGYVQLAGPSLVEQLSELRLLFAGNGAGLTLIDGALSRKSPAAGVPDGAVILSTGASYDRSMDLVVRDTAYACDILSLPPAEKELLARFRHGAKFEVLYMTGETHKAQEPEQAVGLMKAGAVRALWIAGAVMDAQIQKFLLSGVVTDGLTIIADDGSRVLLSEESYRRMRQKGAVLLAANPTQVAAITVNPVSAGGWAFPQAAFVEAMQAAVQVPVIDVEAQYD